MEKFKIIAERFIEYLKDGDFDKPFQFELKAFDGVSDWFGTKVVRDFDNYIFVTSLYGGVSNGTASLLMIDDFEESFLEEYYEDVLKEITEHYYNNYKDWEPVICQ